MKKLKIALLMGGWSAERAVSLASGREVLRVLKEDPCYEVKVYDPKDGLKKLLAHQKEIDLVLPILHGPYGEDGTIQGFLELLQIPYAFSGVLASALAMDKYRSRQIFQAVGLPVPRYLVLKRGKTLKKPAQYPVVVKPNRQGSSIGVSICQDFAQFQKAVKEAFRYDEIVLVEEYIPGKEITVAVLDERALPVIEIVPKKTFFDFQAKYDGTTEEIVPARLSLALTKKAQEYALKAHLALGCRGLSRTDMILSQKNHQFYLLELNTIPGLTKESLVPKAAKAAGLDFKALILEIIKLALKEEDEKKT